MHLYVAGSRVDATATLTASIAPTSGAVANLQDDDVSTGARWLSCEGVALTWDFGAGGGVDIDAVRVGSTNATQAEFPVFLSMWFSDDAATWTRHADWAADYPGLQQKTAGFYNWQPNDIGVVAQLEFVGTNGSTTFADDVPGNVWTPVGSAQIKTDQFKWGGSAGYFNGTTSYLTMPAKASLNLVLRNFVIEAWIRLESLTNNYNTILANGLTSFGTSAAFLMVYGNSAPAVANRGKIAIGNGQTNPVAVSTTVVTPGVWYRVKAAGINGVVLLYVNDVLEASLTTPATFDFSLSGTVVGRNGWDGAAGYFAGHVGELRIAGAASDDGTVPAYTRHPLLKKTLQTRTAAPDGKVQSALQMWPFTGAALISPPARTRGDYLTGVVGKGIGRVRGFTLDYVNPLNKPYPCRVRLVRESDGLQLRETWSNASGAYDFQYVDELQSYTVIAYYIAHGKRAVVTDGLTLANGKVELMA